MFFNNTIKDNRSLVIKHFNDGIVQICGVCTENPLGAKGLCQERAFVSGLEAANALSREGVLGLEHGRQHAVLPVRDDEPQVVAGRALNKALADAFDSNPINKALGLRASPWVR